MRVHPLLLFVAWLILSTVPSAGGEPAANRRGEPLPTGAVARLGDVRFWWKNCYLSSLVFSPDSKTLAVTADRYPYERLEEPAIRLLEIPSGWERHRLGKLPPAMKTAAFSPDGQSLAGVHSSADGLSLRLSVWDLAKGARRYSFDLGNQQSPAVAYSPDGRCLASTADKTVSLRDAATGQELRRLEGHASEIVALAFSPDGKILASSGKPSDGSNFRGEMTSHRGTLRLWDIASGKSIHEIDYSGQSALQALHFSRDGKSLAAWQRQGDILLYETETGNAIRTIRGKFSTAAFSADGKLLATGGTTIRLWELPTGRELRSFPGSTAMRLLAMSPDGKMLAAVEGEQGGRLRLWDVVRGEEIVPYQGHRSAVQSLSGTADGRTLISAGADGTIRIWDVAERTQQRVLEERKANFRSVVVSPDGQTIAAMDAKDAVTFWSATGEKLGHFPGNGQGNSFGRWPSLKPLLAFSTDSRTAFAGRADGVLRLWEAGPAKAPRILRADEDGGIPTVLAPDGALVASIGRSGRLGNGSDALHLRRLGSGMEVHQIKGEGSVSFWTAAFSPDSRILAVSRSWRDEFHGHLSGHRLLFWEAASGKPFLSINLPQWAPTLAFSPDGKLLATANGVYPFESDRTIRIWDVTTGKLLEQLTGHGSEVNALLFSPDGRRLFSGAADGTILIWDTRWPHPQSRRTRGELTAEQLRSAWEDLASADAAQAFRSLRDLAADPRHAVPFLREHLPKPPPLDPQRIARLIVELDNDDFAVRENARRELEKQDENAEEALRKTLQNRPSLEVRRRVEALLERLHPFPARAEQLQMSRAMLALEWMDAPEARQLIEELARGTPGARLTREAKAAQQRLLRRGAGKTEPRP